MSGPTIKINDTGSMPEISAVSDIGSTVEITNIHDYDLAMFGNQKKVGNVPRSPSVSVAPEAKPISIGSVGDDIEFVNLEDTQVTFDIKPPVNSDSSDTIKILRDTGPSIKFNDPPVSIPSPPSAPALPPASAPAPAPAASKSWFSNLPGLGGASGGGSESSSGGGIRSWLGGGGSAALPAASEQPVQTYLTPEQEHVKKMEGLTLLERMDRKGIGGTKMTIANTLDEINAEVARRKDSKALEASIRFQRSMLTTVTNGMEFLNNRYDPFGVALDGWSESVHENIEDYDEIFEELYDKYKDKSKVAPEVRLIMSLGLSAAMCHVTNTMFKSKMPGMDDIFRKNPDLAQQMARAAAEQAVGPGFANFVSMGMPGGGGGGSGPRGPPSGAQTPRMEEEDTMPRMPMGFMGNMGAPIASSDPRGDADVPPSSTARREMRGPSGVDDILRTLSQAGDIPQRSVPPPAVMEVDDIASIHSGVTTDTMRRAGISRKRKATTTQPTGATLTLNV